MEGFRSSWLLSWAYSFRARSLSPPLDNALIWRQDCFFFSTSFLPPSSLPSPHTPTSHSPYFHHGAQCLGQNSYCIKSDKWMNECHYLASEESSLIFFQSGMFGTGLSFTFLSFSLFPWKHKLNLVFSEKWRALDQPFKIAWSVLPARLYFMGLSSLGNYNIKYVPDQQVAFN